MSNPPSGFPTPSTTGVPAGTVLTAYAGPMTVSVNGTVIDSKTITGQLTVTGANVTISKCKILTDSTYGVDSEGSNLLIVDTEITRISANAQATSTRAVNGGSFTLRRVYIHNLPRGVGMWGNNTSGSPAILIEDSYIDDLVASTTDHTTAIAAWGGAWNVTIRHNTLGNGTPGGQPTGIISAYQDYGLTHWWADTSGGAVVHHAGTQTGWVLNPQTNVDEQPWWQDNWKVTNNYFSGTTGLYDFTVGNSSFLPKNTNFQFGNNWVGVEYNANSGQDGVVAAWSTSATNYWWNNLWYAPGQTRNGTAANVAVPTDTGPPGGDTVAPVIALVAHTETQTSTTFTWATNESSNSKLIVLTKPDSVNASMVTSHSVTTSGLTPGTNYQAVVQSTDAAGNTSTYPTTGTIAFTTTPSAAQPPVLALPSATAVTQTSATINWITDKFSDSYVFIYGKVTPGHADTGVGVTSHHVNITGLAAGTTYTYSASSKDPITGLTGTLNSTFTTTGVPVGGGNVCPVTPNNGSQDVTGAMQQWIDNVCAAAMASGTTAVFRFPAGARYQVNGFWMMSSFGGDNSHDAGTINFIGNMLHARDGSNNGLPTFGQSVTCPIDFDGAGATFVQTLRGPVGAVDVHGNQLPAGQKWAAPDAFGFGADPNFAHSFRGRCFIKLMDHTAGASFKNITFVSGKPVLAAFDEEMAEAHAFYFGRSSNVTIDNCKADQVEADFLYWRSMHNSNVTNCRFTDSGRHFATMTDWQHVKILRNTVHYYRTGFDSEQDVGPNPIPPTFDVEIGWNEFGGHKNNLIAHTSSPGDMYDINIHDNHLVWGGSSGVNQVPDTSSNQRSSNFSIFITPEGGPGGEFPQFPHERVTGWVIRNNVVDRSADAQTLSGPMLISGGDGVVIDGNTLGILPNYPAFWGKDPGNFFTAAAKNVSITNNTFFSVGGAGPNSVADLNTVAQPYCEANNHDGNGNLYNPGAFACSGATGIYATSVSAVTQTTATVTWTTTSAATTQVAFGTSPYVEPFTTAFDATPRTAHSATITGLTAGTTYYFTAQSVVGGTQMLRATGSFTTTPVIGPPPPPPPPPPPSAVVSGLAVDAPAGQTTATVRWTTDVAASGTVLYGPTSAYGSSVNATQGNVTAHVVQLTGLAAGTTYYVNVFSAAPGQGIPTGAPNAPVSFATAGTAPPPALTVSNLVVDQVTTTTARVSWQSNMNASTQVDYGTGPYLGTFAPVPANATPTTNHVVTISGLIPSTTYAVNGLSQDFQGGPLVAFTTAATFTTGSVVAPPPPPPPPGTTARNVARIKTLFSSDFATLPGLTKYWGTGSPADFTGPVVLNGQLHWVGNAANGGTGAVRRIYVPTGVAAVADGEVVSRWTFRGDSVNGGIGVQHGHCHRVVPISGTQATFVSITRNIFAGVPATGVKMNEINFHWFNGIPGSVTPGNSEFNIFGTVVLDYLLQPPGGNLDFPWNVKSRVVGTTLEVAVWLDSETEPAYGDPRHGGGFQIPATSPSASGTGMNGLYMAHLVTTSTSDVDNMRVYELAARKFTRRTFNDADILNLTASTQLRGRAEFDLLDKNGSVLTQVNPVKSSPSITAQASDTVKRKMSGLKLTPADFALVEPASDRIRPMWVLETGSRFPLGVFVFSDVNRHVTSAGEWMEGTLSDLTVILDQPRGGAGIRSNPFQDLNPPVVPIFGDGSVSLPYGTDLNAAVKALLGEVGFRGVSYVLDGDRPLFAPRPLSWSSGTSRYKIIADIFALLDYYPPFFDNAGVLRGKSVPHPLSGAGFDHDYGEGTASRIIAQSIIEADDWVKAPNRYLVVETGAAKTPVVGVYDIPAQFPHSFENRGYRVVKKVSVSGLGASDASTVGTPGTTSQQLTAQQAAALAEREAIIDLESGLTHITFESTPDPRHDLFQIVRYRGTSYREEGFTFDLGTGKMTHKLRGIY